MVSACSQHQATNKLSKAWILNSAYSKISIITTKNSKVSEISHFNLFSGKIDESLNLNISIDLSSLETNIPIRNKRIQEHLFQSTIYPTADIHTQLQATDLTPGTHKISFDVDLHGVSSILQAEFMVFEQHGNKVITLHTPLIIDAGAFGLESGITTLKNLAKLQSIDFTVPVNLVLSFQPL
jgi:polyisoprenoid-binding protein YceI